MIMITLKVLLLALLLLSIMTTSAAEMEAKWTPNDDDDGGQSLPLSMNQRQQLLQLQQAIQNSPDPNGTLQQVAQSNGMSATDLYKMIEKNSNDLQQDPQLLSELQKSFASKQSLNSLPKKIVASLVVAIRQVAKKNPRAFTMAAIFGMLIIYTLLAIPRNGLHISSGRSFLVLSNGPTSVFSPPDRYVHKLIAKQAASMKRPKLSVQTMKKDWDDLLSEHIIEEDDDDVLDDIDDDELTINGKVLVHKLDRRSELRQAFTAQFDLSPDSILEKFPLGETKGEIAAERESIVDFLLSDASSVLSERNILEFSSSKAKDRLRSICGNGRNDDDHGDDKNLGVIVSPYLGRIGLLKGYGLLHWMVTNESTHSSSIKSRSSSSTLTLTTLKDKGFFDGQIFFDVRTDAATGTLIVQVSIAVPKGGRKVPSKFGEQLVEEMARSVLQSSSRRTQQRLARRSQGKRFKESGSRRADKRRRERFERTKLLEEMAEDRRRRWQKQNPDAGRYRPSGHRMMSPNNC